MCRDALRRDVWRGRRAAFPWSRCRQEFGCRIVGGIFRILPRAAIRRRKRRCERRKNRRSGPARLRAEERRKKWARRKKQWDEIFRRFARRDRGADGPDRAQCSGQKTAGKKFRCRGRKRNKASRRRKGGRQREGRGRARRSCER